MINDDEASAVPPDKDNVDLVIPLVRPDGKPVRIDRFGVPILKKNELA